MQQLLGPHDRHLIMATTSHTPKDYTEEIMVACDLAILGRPLEEYKRYARGIRKEYSFVPGMVYRTERIKILLQLRNYSFPSYWPDPAYTRRLVENIEYEIDGLKHNAILPDNFARQA
jgi:predicted metal-dependent HD superfamily phosphohydrolase